MTLNFMKNSIRRIGLRAGLKIAAVTAVLTTQLASAQAATPFATLQAPFTQELYAVTTGFVGGTSFDPAGNLVADNCDAAGGALTRFDTATTIVSHGSTIHPGTTFASGAGCGLAISPDKTFYSNTFLGAANLDPTTGAVIRTIGVAGNALGIAIDPQTNHIVYVGEGCRTSGVCPIENLDPVTGVSTVLTTLTGTSFADGIAFDPTGNFLFISTRAPTFALTVVTRTGSFIRNVAMTSEPDGISFHAADPKFVVTANTNGTMSRFDFPGNDFTQAPTTSVFASGGFRSDLSVVGPDGCIYVPQDGTRFADGTVVGQDSIVKICGGFSSTTGIPPAAKTPPSCALTGVVSGPPKQVQITVQDSDNGIQSVEVTESNNATVAVPTFATGATGALVVVATKIDQGQGSQIALRVTDTNGAITDCDPVVPGEAEASSDAAPETAAGGCAFGRASGVAGLPALVGLVGLAWLGRRRRAAQRKG